MLGARLAHQTLLSSTSWLNLVGEISRRRCQEAFQLDNVVKHLQQEQDIAGAALGYR